VNKGERERGCHFLDCFLDAAPLSVAPIEIKE